MFTIIIIVAGLYSGMKMKLETIPDITVPVVSITTVYPGATPEEVADKVTEPIEQAVQSMTGVKVVSSSSFQNASSVMIEYTYETDMDEALSEVEEAVKQVNLPDSVKDPEASRISINAMPILALSVTSDKEDLPQLTKEVKEKIAPALKGIDGVADVQISGQQVEEVQLTFKEKKLKQLGLSEDTVKGIIQGSDVRMPLGLFTFKDQEKAVVVDGKLMSLKELKNLKIPVVPAAGNAASTGASASGTGGQPGTAQAQAQAQTPGASQTQPGAQIKMPTVNLDEIADIKIIGDAESISRTNGDKSIGVSVVKATEANTVDVANDIKKEVKDLKKDIDGLEITTSLDQAEPIEESVSTMLNKALFGALFAVVIIMLFLRNIRTTFISIISIPVSLLIAVLLLKQMDISLNIMTLGAMTVAIGRVIDDSIVVIENIYRRMALKNETLTGKDLIREATKEMFIPIMSSTIVTIAVFLPLGLVTGMVGELFLPFALTVVFALLASLLVAITIVPMLAHSLMSKKGINKKHHTEHDKPGRLAGGYRKLLNACLNHKWITSLVAILLLVGSLFLVPHIGVSFLPTDEEKMIYLTYKSEPGQTIDEVDEIIKDAEKFLGSRKDIKTYQVSLGGENPMNPGSTKDALLYVTYKDSTENFGKEKDYVVKHLQKNTDVGEWKSQDFASAGTSNEVQYFVYGDKMDEIAPVVEKLQKLMKDNGNFKNVETSMSEAYDQYTLAVDQKKMAQLGLTAAQIGQQLNPNKERPVLTTVENDGEELKVYLETAKSKTDNIDDLTNQKIQSPTGQQVTIKDLVKVKEGKTSDTITRRDGKTYVEVSGTLTTDDVSKATTDLNDKVDKITLPSGTTIGTGGVTEDIQESFTQLGLAMLAAIAIVYLVLVITFGGGLAPFAILFSLPFAIIGGLVGLWIAGETISISALIGALMLIGIVVTNAIVLIDRVIHMERAGLSTREALLEAGTTRLRPILMTALATVGALLPLAFGFEGGGLISKGLGVTVIGGLTSSTLLTLVIVPIVYEAISKIGRRKRRSERPLK